MGKLFLKALKIFFIILLVLLVIAGLVWLVIYKNWPWWIGVSIFAGLFSLVLFILFIKKWYFRHREKKFVKRVIDEDKERLGDPKLANRQIFMDLQERWRQAIEVLRQSNLRRFGNPLYALPWYLIMGESGSGKTAAVKSARLSSPLTDVTPITSVDGTKNCDWWFLDEAVIMDTAGRYSSALDPARDKEEWREFLTLLAKHRRKEPISGLIISIAADKLLSGDIDSLVTNAKAIRRRVDEMMRSLGARFPVYLLVTKLDQVPGMMDFFNGLPERELHQAMGWLNVNFHLAPEDVVSEAVTDISNRLKDLRLWILDLNKNPNGPMIVFPDTLERMRQGLAKFARTLFDRNLFQETPEFRGLFFASAIQGDEDRIWLPETLETFRSERIKRHRTDKGFFLHDVFSAILPNDRRLYSPLFEFIKWRKLTHALALTAALAVIFSICGLFTFSYIKNKSAMSAFMEDITQVPTLTNDMSKDLLLLSDFREQLNEMNTMNQNWLLPRMGFNQSLQAQNRLERLYTDLFRVGLEQPLDVNLARTVNTFSDSTPESTLTRFIAHMVARINLLDAVLSGNSASMKKMPPPDERVFTIINPDVASEIAESYNKLYITYLQLNKTPGFVEQERERLMGMLKNTLRAKRMEFYWLADWANDLTDLTPVTMDDYWGLTAKPHDPGPVVPPAFTIKGRERITQFIEQIQKAMDNPNDLAPQIQQFNKWYAEQYVKTWENFALGFSDALRWERSQMEWKALTRNMSSVNNPFFEVLDTMSVELQPYAKDAGNYPWVSAVMDFQVLKDKAKEKDVASTEKSIISDIKSGKSLINELTGDNKQATQNPVPDQVPAAASINKLTLARKTKATTEDILSVTDQYNDYLKSLGQIMPSTVSSEAAFTMVSNFFSMSKNPTENKSPFHIAYMANLKIDEALEPQNPMDPVFFDLLIGPLHFLLDYSMAEATQHLQDTWEGDVLSSVRSAPEAKKSSILFDKKNGVVWKFVDGPASPFIDKKQYGYSPRKFLRWSIPFTDEFFRFIEQGAVENQATLDKYAVSIQALPTDSNAGSSQDPYATILTLNCSKGAIKLENYNYPAKKDIEWKPGECGDTSFQILFNDFTLERKYEGDFGFPKFLDDFRFGSRTFSPKDFPEEEEALKQLGISELTINYTFSGNMPVINLLYAQHLDVPQVIAHTYSN